MLIDFIARFLTADRSKSDNSTVAKRLLNSFIERIDGPRNRVIGTGARMAHYRLVEKRRQLNAMYADTPRIEKLSRQVRRSKDRSIAKALSANQKKAARRMKKATAENTKAQGSKK